MDSVGGLRFEPVPSPKGKTRLSCPFYHLRWNTDPSLLSLFYGLWNRPSYSISCRRRLCMNLNTHKRLRGQLFSFFDLRYLLIEGFKPLKRKLLSLRLKPCGGFRRVTPTFFQFLDNRSPKTLSSRILPWLSGS